MIKITDEEIRQILDIESTLKKESNKDKYDYEYDLTILKKKGAVNYD